jgi:hypothetical protein
MTNLSQHRQGPTGVNAVIIFGVPDDRGSDDKDRESDCPHRCYRSRRTPLNFLAAFLPLAGFFTAMYSPVALLRLVQALAPPSVVLR